MRWWIFIPVLAVVMAIDVAFMPALAIGRTSPALWPVLLGFVAMYASRESALLAGLATGALLDAASPGLSVSADGVQQAVPVFGPWMLGCTAGAWAVLELRGLLYRRNTATIAFAALVCAVVAGVAFLAVAGLRSAYADPAPLWGASGAGGALGRLLLGAGYAALLGLVPARGLHATLGAWDFATAGPRFGPGRA